MYLNSPPPIWVGNLYYGYSKDLAWVSRSDTGSQRAFMVRDMVERFAAGTTSGPSGKPAHYDEMRTILAMPILRHTSFLSGTWFICSYWHWDDSAVAAAPIDGTVEFKQVFIPGMEHWPDQGIIASVPDGACRLSGLRWSMAFPPIGCGF